MHKSSPLFRRPCYFTTTIHSISALVIITLTDATPQELSGGTYQTGPAPLVAVKDGIKDVLFDLEFIYSEVNADER